MNTDDPRLLALTDAVLDGTAVDWADAESRVPAAARGAVRQLQLVATVGRICRDDDRDPIVACEEACTWGSFIIIERIGRGSFGVTYRARDTRLDREVALKLLPDRKSADAGALVDEARLLARVHHPNVVAVYGVERNAGCIGIAMELVRGRTLDQTVGESGPLSSAEAAVVGADVCRGLAAVHQAGIIHRDVKARNIARAEDGRVVLMDFGAGRESAHDAGANDVTGTPLYLAPELLIGQSATPQSDIYSVGVLLFWLVTDTYPIDARSFSDVREAHGAGVYRRLRDLRPDLPRRLVAVVERALAQAPGDRYATAGELEAALAGVVPQARTLIPRGRTLAIAAVAMVVASAAASWMWLRRAPTLPFAARDWVLVGDIDNLTGEPVLEGTLRFALERELANSPFVSVVPRERINDELKLMERPIDTRLDASAARELALRDGGIRALVTGRAEKVGGQYLLTASLMNSSSGALVSTIKESAPSEAQLLAAVQREAVSVREALGEKLDAVQKNPVPLEQVTTASLHALQLYSQGMALMAEEPMQEAPAGQLFTQAIQEDRDFAMAHLLLAYSLMNGGRPPDEFLPEVDRAFQLLDHTTTEYERYFILGGYHSMHAIQRPGEPPDDAAKKEHEQAAAAFQVLLKIRPNDYWAANNLRNELDPLGQVPDTVLLDRIADVRPRVVAAQIDAARAWLFQESNANRANDYVARARTVLTSTPNPFQEAQLAFFLADEAWLGRDVPGVERAAKDAEKTLTEQSTMTAAQRNALGFDLAALYLTLGQLHNAERVLGSSSTPAVKTVWLDVVAQERGDVERLKQDLIEQRGSAAMKNLSFAMLCLDAGLLAEAKEAIAVHPKINATYAEFENGRVALAEGRDAQAMLGLTQFVDDLRTVYRDRAPVFDAVVRIAEVLQKQGDLDQAIRRLEEESSYRVSATSNGSWVGRQWLRMRAQLADVYRAAGREQDAQAVERELLALLSGADPDYPLLSKLKARTGQTH